MADDDDDIIFIKEQPGFLQKPPDKRYMRGKGQRYVLVLHPALRTQPLQRYRFRMAVDKLGGVAKPNSPYHSEITHYVVPSSKIKSLTPTPFGCLATGKYIVTWDFIVQSLRNKYFVDETDFIPTDPNLKSIIDRTRNEKLFDKRNFVVLLDDKKRQGMYADILKDAGANVFEYSPKQLAGMHMDKIRNIEKVFTEPRMTRDPDFCRFLHSVRRKHSIKVLSFYYLYNFVLNIQNPNDRVDIERKFDILNFNELRLYHKDDGAVLKRPFLRRTLGNENKRAKVDSVEVVTVDSESDEDVQVVHVDSAKANVKQGAVKEERGEGCEEVNDKPPMGSSVGMAGVEVGIKLKKSTELMKCPRNREEDNKLPLATFRSIQDGSEVIDLCEEEGEVLKTPKSRSSTSSSCSSSSSSSSSSQPSSRRSFQVSQTSNRSKDAAPSSSVQSSSPISATNLENSLNQSSSTPSKLSPTEVTTIESAGNTPKASQGRHSSPELPSTDRSSSPISIHSPLQKRCVVENDTKLKECSVKEDIPQDTINNNREMNDIEVESPVSSEPFAGKQRENAFHVEGIVDNDVDVEVQTLQELELYQQTAENEGITKAGSPQKNWHIEKPSEEYPSKDDILALTHIFGSRTKVTDECLDIGNSREHSFKFCRHTEANRSLPKEYFNKRTKRFASNEMPNSFAVNTFLWDNQDDRSVERVFSLDIEEIESTIGSSWYLLPKHVKRLCQVLEANSCPNTQLGRALKASVELVFWKTSFIHYPTNEKMRESFKKIFKDYELTKLLEGNRPKILRFTVTMLRKDFEYWWKHLIRYNDIPLISYLCGGTKVDPFNESVVGGDDGIVARFVTLIQQKHCPSTKETIGCQFQIISMIALYCSAMERNRSREKYLHCQYSWKRRFANIISRYLLRSAMCIRDVVTTSFRLKPSWLSLMVLENVTSAFIHNKVSCESLEASLKVGCQLKDLSIKSVNLDTSLPDALQRWKAHLDAPNKSKPEYEWKRSVPWCFSNLLFDKFNATFPVMMMACVFTNTKDLKFPRMTSKNTKRDSIEKSRTSVAFDSKIHTSAKSFENDLLICCKLLSDQSSDEKILRIKIPQISR